MEMGLLMNKTLTSLNPAQIIAGELRERLMNHPIYTKNKGIFYKDVVQTFLEWYQRARYEEFIFVLAEALVGYQFYLPAFLYFRGRIYRAGFLHFHERDLVRGLIVFAKPDFQIPEDEYSLTWRRVLLYIAAMYHVKKESSYENAILDHPCKEDEPKEELLKAIPRSPGVPFNILVRFSLYIARKIYINYLLHKMLLQAHTRLWHTYC